MTHYKGKSFSNRCKILIFGSLKAREMKLAMDDVGGTHVDKEIEVRAELYILVHNLIVYQRLKKRINSLSVSFISQ